MRTILVVEDETVARLAIRTFLEDAGFQVFEAASAEEALELCRIGAEIDALLVDYSLPKMKGDALAREVRKIFPRASVTYMSGHADLELDPPGPVLAKPLDLETIAATIARAAER